jgi:hypothetical protein
VDAELATLAGTGATTVVALMVTETWEQARQRVLQLFARSSEAHATSADLDDSRSALATAAGTPDEEDLTSDTTAMIRLRLRRLLEQDPDAHHELRLFIQEFAATTPHNKHSPVDNSITGGTQHGPVLQGHTFSNLTLHNSQTPTTDQ